MFANLKKKIQEEGGTSVIPGGKQSNSNTPTGSKTSSGHSVNAQGRKNGLDQVLDDSLARYSDDVLAEETSGSREDIVELLLKRTRQVKTLEARLSELTSLVKEKNQMIEKLEVALEKQQDVLCQRVQEISEQYSSYRSKSAENVAAAVKRKEDSTAVEPVNAALKDQSPISSKTNRHHYKELRTQMNDLEKKNAQLEEKVLDHERTRERFAERQDVKEELEAFSTQELTKVKHMLLKAQEELELLRSHKCESSDNGSTSSSEDVNKLQKHLLESYDKRSELETKNTKLSELVAQLQADLVESKEALNKMTNHSTSSQEDWLEKQIESEKCISNLEDCIKSLKTELAQRDSDRGSLVKQITEQLIELNATKSQLKSEQDRASVLLATVESHSVITTCLQQRCDQSDSDYQDVKLNLLAITSELETCRAELVSCRSEFDSSVERSGGTIDELERTVHRLTNEQGALQQRISDLEESRAGDIALVEADVTARLQSEMRSLEDQIQDKNKVIKKQEQRLADLKKLLQRELKVLPPGADFAISASQLMTAENGSSNGALRIDLAAAAAAAAVGVHTSAQHHSQSDAADPSSPATLTVSEVSRHRNGVTDGMSASLGGITPWPSAGRGDGVATNGRTRRASHRASIGANQASSLGGGVMMSPVDSEYDFMRELNFKYLRHVVLKFMLSRETEALQLIKAVSMLLHFTPEEQSLIRDTLEWKKSWFGSRPQLPANGQQAKVIPPSF